MRSFVTLRWEDEEGVDPPEEHVQPLFDDNRVYWSAVEKAFDARKVELRVDDWWTVPPVYGPEYPEKAGMTVDTFVPGATVLVKPYNQGGGILSVFRRVLGVELTFSQLTALLSHTVFMRAFKQGLIDEAFARRVLDDIRAVLSTSTKASIFNHQGYVFGDHEGSIGQGRSVLYDVFKGASVCCGKVFHSKDRGAAQHEQHVSTAVHGALQCPTLIEVTDFFDACSHSILIMPLLAKSLEDLRVAASPLIPSSNATCAHIAAGVLAAMAGLAMAGWCHGDIKPQNIMLAAGEQPPVLIDLGSCTEVHKRLRESTPTFGLGLPEVAGLQWDLACLATTLFYTASPIATPLPGTLEEMRQQLSCLDAESLSLGHRTALRICEVHQRVGDVQQLRELVWAALMQDIQTSLGIDTAEFEGWWPTRRTSAGA